jgi:hypothetical protein
MYIFYKIEDSLYKGRMSRLMLIIAIVAALGLGAVRFVAVPQVEAAPPVIEIPDHPDCTDNGGYDHRPRPILIPCPRLVG